MSGRSIWPESQPCRWTPHAPVDKRLRLVTRAKGIRQTAKGGDTRGCPMTMDSDRSTAKTSTLLTGTKRGTGHSEGDQRRLSSRRGSVAGGVLVFTLLGVTFATGCARSFVPTVHCPSAAPEPLSPQVYLLAPDDMRTWWCHEGFFTTGTPTRRTPRCPDFRDPPVETVASFEARLPCLLARERQPVVGSIESYVRQYWAEERKGTLFVYGRFACRSYVVTLDSIDADIRPWSEEELSRVPISLDDAGDCFITLFFPAERPDDVFVR